MTARFYIPTKVLLGEDIVRQSSGLLAEIGSRALIVTGRESARHCGALGDVIAALAMEKIDCEVFDEVEANPSVETCRRASAAAQLMNADFIVGIGGGSPLDASKITAILARNEISDEALYSGAFRERPLPVAAIPTTAGTGSEETPYAILTNPQIESKSNVSSEAIFPVLALLDGRYIASLPRDILINTTVDALSHAVEGYLSRRSDCFSRCLSADAMAILGVRLKKIAAEIPLSKEDFQELLSGACLAGMVIAHTGTTAAHALGYSLTYFKGFAHGRANGVLLPALLSFIAGESPEPVQKVVEAIGLRDVGDFKDLIRRLLGPSESLSTSEKEKFAEIAMKARNRLNTLRVPERADLVSLLSSFV